MSWRFVIAAWVLWTVSRLALCAWQWRRVHMDGVVHIIEGGLRIDTSLLAMVAGFPLLLSPWLGSYAWAHVVTLVWFAVWWAIVVLLEIATPQFITEYDTRPNRLFVAYLGNPREVGTMLWRGYKLAVFGGLVLWVALAWLGIVWIRGPLDPIPGSVWSHLILTAGLFVGLFLVGRGSLGHRPLNAAQVAFAGDAMVNTLPLNSTFVVANAILAMRDDKPADTAYGRMDEARMHAIMRSELGLADAPLDAEVPTLRDATASVQTAAPKHIVIIVQESLGAQFVGCLGGQNLTPHIDALAREGWLLAQHYATGTRSVRGLEAVVAGFPPTPAESVLKLPRSQRDFFTLAGLLGELGYRSRFVYGGEAHFDNMKGFFLANGFDEVIDMPKFTHRPQFVGSWGASDEDMYAELHQRLLSDTTGPALTVAFTVSNHSPWEYPKGRITPEGEPASVDNTVRYADWALGQFFAGAKKEAYWDNTVFVVVADHDARVWGANLIPAEHFHIPALFLGGGIPARRDEGVCSQIDLAPTLLSLAGVSCRHPMPGMDLTQVQPNRALMQYGGNFGFLRSQHLVVLQPEKPAEQFAWRLEGAAMQSEALGQDLAEVALAYSKWPGWAYFNQRYRVPENVRPRSAQPEAPG